MIYMCKSLYYLNQKTPDKIFVYIHGGPFFTILSPQDDPFAYHLFKKEKNIVLINYPTVLGKGGIDDYNYIYSKIIKLRYQYKKANLYLIGESYGGFLASLFSSKNIFKKIICLSGFASINYQELFSSEKSWLINYLSKSSKDFYFLQKNTSIKVPIVFINGKKDKQIPWQQFLPLLTSSNINIKVKLFDDYVHREHGKKLKSLLNYFDSIIP